MGTAYTPGLTVSGRALVRKTRRLPLKGKVLVRVGDEVEPHTLVARTELPGNVTIVRAAEQLGVEAHELPKFLHKGVGETVEKGELIAETPGLFGRFFKARVEAPVTGTIETITEVTGNLTIRHPPKPVEVKAYLRGTVVEVMPGEGAVIETRGAWVQGIFGIGGEASGPLQIIAESPAEIVPPERLNQDHRGGVLMVGGRVTYDLLLQAREVGAVAVIAAGILDPDLRRFLGYDLGVAITGNEEVGLTLVLTEGFGEIAMARRTFDLLSSLSGREASVSGATQIRAGVLRPEVIVPRPELPPEEVTAHWSGTQDLEIGTPIRLIREPYFGALGEVVALPPELQEIETGAKVRVLVAKLQNGQEVTVPRANVEIVGG